MLTQKLTAEEDASPATAVGTLPPWLARIVDARPSVVALGLVAAILLPEIAISGRLPSVRVEQLLLPYALLVFWADRRRGLRYEIGLLDWLFAALALSTLVSILGAPLILRTRLSPRDFYELLKPALYYAYYRLALGGGSRRWVRVGRSSDQRGAEPSRAPREASAVGEVPSAQESAGPHPNPLPEGEGIAAAKTPGSPGTTDAVRRLAGLPAIRVGRARHASPLRTPTPDPHAVLRSWLSAVLLLAGSLCALVGVLQYFNWLRVNEWLTPLYAPEHHLVVVRSAGRVVGTFSNPNYFGIFCAILALAALLSFWLRQGSRQWGAVGRPAPAPRFSYCLLPTASCLVAAAACLGLVFSGSRTALLALVAAVSGLALLALVRRLAVLRLLVGVSVLGVVLVGTVGIAEAFPHGQVDYLGRVSEGFNLNQDASFGLRLARWRGFLDAWLPHQAAPSDIHASLTSVRATGTAAAPPEVRARDTQRKADLLRLARAIDAYHLHAGRWPDPAGLAAALVPNYLPSLPLDPSTGQPYSDASTASGYSLEARLEDPSDPDYPTYGIGSSPNYLLNGSLEQGSGAPDDWDAIPGTSFSLAHGDALYGDHAVLYHGDPANPARRAGIFQQRYFGRPGGQPFTASVWVELPKSAAGQLELYANVIYTDGGRADPLTRVPVDMGRTGVWQRVSLAILTPAGKDISFMGIYVISEGFSGDALLDGFELVDGPVPLTFSLTREAPVSDALGFNPEAKLRRSPLIGVGPEKAAQGGSVDDEYLLYAARYGLVGIVLYLALYLGTLALALRAFVRRERGVPILPALIAATLVAFFIFNLTAGSFYELQLMAIFWLLAGAALATQRSSVTDDTIGAL